MSKIKVIEGKTLFDESRKYTFQLMNAETGLKVFHEAFIPILVPLIIGFGNDESGIDVKGLIQIIPETIKWEKLQSLARDMLSGAIIEIDGIRLEAGPTGISEYALEDPMEVYTAIFYALAANFPKYVNPLLEGEETGDTGQPPQNKTKA